MLVSFNVESGLTVILLIAAIVVCVFLIILLSKLIGTVDQVNEALDETLSAIGEIKKKLFKTVDTVKAAGEKVTQIAATGTDTVKSVVKKLPFTK